LLEYFLEHQNVIDKNSHIPLYLQIQIMLREQIRAGKFGPGDQIPSEQKLAKEHNISRMTVRKAIEGLVSKGHLFRMPGKGTFVTRDIMTFGFSTMLSFSRTFQARGFSVSTRMIRFATFPGPSNICDRLNLDSGSEVLIVRRLRSIDGLPVAIHTSYLDARAFGALSDYDLINGSILMAMEQIYGVHMASTKDTVRADLGNQEDCQLLGYQDCRPVLIVEGTSYDPRGNPTRYTEAIYRGDVFELVIVNTHDQASSLAIVRNDVNPK
jgi:GntR family transcriptional regulator